MNKVLIFVLLYPNENNIYVPFTRSPFTFIFIFFCFASAQSYWKSQWVTSQANVKTLKTDEETLEG